MRYDARLLAANRGIDFAGGSGVDERASFRGFLFPGTAERDVPLTALPHPRFFRAKGKRE